MSYTAPIKSDSTDETYTVRVDNNGVAVSCTCKGWQYRGSCKHLERAELLPAFLNARQRIQKFFDQSREEFNENFHSIVERFRHEKQDKGEAVNLAIRHTIFVSDHINLTKDACPRCSGKRFIERFSNVLNGICFRCWGQGYILPQDEKKIAEETASNLEFPTPEAIFQALEMYRAKRDR